MKSKGLKSMKIKISLFLAVVICLNILLGSNQASLAIEMAIVNLKSHVYHETNCKRGKKCTKSCITTSKQRAIKIYKARAAKCCHKRK